MPDQLTIFSGVLIARETLDPQRGGHVVLWPDPERLRATLTFMEDCLEMTGKRMMGGMIEVSLAATPAGRRWPGGNRGRAGKIGSWSDLPIRSLPPPLKALQQRPPSSLAAQYILES